jgi:hypothetical protein
MPPLYDHVLALILQRLTLVDFQAAASTCRSWHNAARKKAAWPCTEPRVCLDMRHVCASNARPLSCTVWAACTSVTCADWQRGGAASQGLERVAVELTHVRNLSIKVPFEGDAVRQRYGHLTSRLTSLRTNNPALAGESLQHLTILSQIHDEWAQQLPTPVFSRLEHLVFCGKTQTLTGVAAAAIQLARTYGRLHTIEFAPRERGDALDEYLFQELLSNARDGARLTSIKSLINAPSKHLSKVLERFPCLTQLTLRAPPSFSSRLVLDASDKPSNDSEHLARLAIYKDLFDFDWFDAPRLEHIVDLSASSHQLSNEFFFDKFPRLRLLRLIPPARIRGPVHTPIAPLPPLLRQLSVCEPTQDKHYESPEPLLLSWTDGDNDLTTVTQFINQVSRLTHMEHIEFRPLSPSALEERLFDMTTMTILLVTAMVQTPSWRHVTWDRPPVTIASQGLTRPQLAPLRWHTLRATYQPHLEHSRWRVWLPGMDAHHIIWREV